MGNQLNTDEIESDCHPYYMVERGRCDNGCIWNSDVHHEKTERESSLERVLDVKTCRKCYRSRPESLEVLCRSKIVSSVELVRMACLVLPSLHIPSLMQYAARRLDATNDLQMESVIKILMEHWPFRVLDLSTLARRKYYVESVRNLAIDRFLETISSGNLMNELVASDCDDVLSSHEPEVKQYWLFMQYIQKRTEEGGINKENLERKYILRTNVEVSSRSEVAMCVRHLEYFRRKNSPFDVRILKITCRRLKVGDLMKTFSVIDPKYAESVCVMNTHLTAENIRRLAAKLEDYQRLSTLFLDIGNKNWNNTDKALDISDAVSTLLDPHLQSIKRLYMKSCPMSGHLDKYRLPMFLTELIICWTNMTVDDFEQFANSYHFPVLARFGLHRFYLCEGVVKFIGNHASTLKKLEMTSALDHHTNQIVALAGHLRRFGILEDFTYDFRFKYANPYEILRELVENFLVIESITHLHLMTKYRLRKSGFRETMRSIVDRISAERKNPFDFFCIDSLE